MNDDLLTVDELAEELRVPAGTFRSWRAQDKGPRSFKIGRRVVYRRSDVAAWLSAVEARTARGFSARRVRPSSYRSAMSAVETIAALVVGGLLTTGTDYTRDRWSRGAARRARRDERELQRADAREAFELEHLRALHPALIRFARAQTRVHLED